MAQFHAVYKKGRMSLPVWLRQMFSIVEGDTLLCRAHPDGRSFVVTPVKSAEDAHCVEKCKVSMFKVDLCDAVEIPCQLVESLSSYGVDQDGNVEFLLMSNGHVLTLAPVYNQV